MSGRSMRLARGGFDARLVFIISCLTLFVWGGSPARAAKIYFGTKEYLNFIQEVAIKGPNGEQLYLGYKYSFYSFILPYSLSDDGYVLGVKDRDSFFRLDKASIEKFQATGLLPFPLPAYELSAMDYAMGHAIWSVPIIMAGAFAFAWPRQRRRQRATAHFANAIRHGQNGDLDQAIAEYTTATEIDPTFESAFINRGGMYERKGDYDRAIADFTKAAQVGPKGMKPLAFINRGLAHQKKRDFDRAIADYSHAIELSKAPAAYFNRGNAFAGMGDYERAIADYTKVIELQPGAAVAYQARSAAHETLGNAVQAQADRSRALEIAGPQRAA